MSGRTDGPNNVSHSLVQSGCFWPIGGAAALQWGAEARGGGGGEWLWADVCNTQFPQGTRTQRAPAHTRTLTHTLHGLKGLPLCGRWINEGWEAEQWSYTMGGWGGQLQCEAWCYYGPGQQWRTPGYRAPQSLSSLCLELWGGWRRWWQEGFQLKEKLKAGWKTAVAFKRVQEEREECGCAEREKKTSVWGARDIKKFYVPVRMRRGPAQHCCGTLKADDSEAQIFAFLSFI